MRNIKSTHKPIINFYAELKQYENLGATNETEVRLAFATLSRDSSKFTDWKRPPLVGEENPPSWIRP